MNPITSDYRPNKGLTTFVILLLGVTAFFALVRAGGALLDVEMLDKHSTHEEMIESGAWIGAMIVDWVVGIPTFVVHVVTIVCFCVWIVGASKNARALGARGMRFSPGWAAGWFFVPVANFVMPCLAACEIWKASDPEAGPEPGSWQRASAGPVALWWTAWMLAILVNNAAFLAAFAGMSVMGTLKAIAFVEMGGGVLSMLAAFAAVSVVRGIRFRQEYKSAIIKAGGARLKPRVGESVPQNVFLRQTPAA